MKHVLFVAGLLLLLSASTHGHTDLMDFLNQLGSRPSSPPPGNNGTKCTCGTSNSRRIVNGKVMENNEYPFMLSMIHSTSGQHFCGASVLTPNMALTAAHCTHDINIPMSVVAGTNDVRTRYGTTQISRVAKVIEHEEYKYKTGVWNDIAILVLETPLRLNSAVVPICMPSGRLDLESEQARVIGWGKTGFTLDSSPILLGIDVKIQAPDLCQMFHPNFDRSTMICVSNPTGTACRVMWDVTPQPMIQFIGSVITDDKAAIRGDSGGPIFRTDPETNRMTLVGLVSYSIAGCYPGVPVVLTDVSAFIPWIKARVPDLLPPDDYSKTLQAILAGFHHHLKVPVS